MDKIKEQAIKESTKVIYHAKVICPIETRVEEDIIVGTRKDAINTLKEFRDSGQYEEEYYEFDIQEENLTNTSKALDIAIRKLKQEVIEIYSKFKVSDTCCIERGNEKVFIEAMQKLYLKYKDGVKK